MSRFEGKRVLVTGGTSGIGKAAAARLAKEGAKVLVTGTNEERLAGVAEELGVATLKNDAGDPEQAKLLAAAVQETLGGLDGVFVNAGFGEFSPIGDFSLDSYERQFNVNLRGPLLQTQALLGLLSDGASIVFNTSVVNRKGMAGASVYGATKAALRNATRTLAQELAPRNVRVNAVSPGPIETNFFERTGLPAEAQQEMGSQIAAQVPLGRFGTAAEAAAVATFLLSDDASFVTGSEYVVDGGMTEV